MKRSNCLVPLVLLVVAGCTTSGRSTNEDLWITADVDRRFSKDELSEMLVGKTLRYESGQWSEFGPDGHSVYHDGKNLFDYDYRITDDGAVCISSAERRERCRLIVMNGDRLISINQRGTRFAAKVE
jgi:hypothetical protein